MAKAAILMPFPELKKLAETLIGDYPRLTPLCVEYVRSAGIAARAKALEEQGCDLIIARGLHARLARDAVRIPIVEMRASTQELESLAMEMKNKLPAGVPPRIAIIGFFNMFHSTERFNELLGIDLRVYTATDIRQYSGLVDRANEDGCRGVIGGEVVSRRAAELHLPSCFLSMGEESMREALAAASMLGYSIDLLKQGNAEMSAMLDNTSTAILETDSLGIIIRANRSFFQLVGRSADQLIGKPAQEAVDAAYREDLEGILREGRETDAVLVTLNRHNALMSTTPVRVEERTAGTILTFQEGKRITEMDSRLRQEWARQGYVAHYTFDEMLAANRDFQRIIAQLRRLSRYPNVVLLSGEAGAGKGMLAQCMHNESLQRDGAFITVDCSIWHPDDLDEKLFGRFSSRKDSDPSMVEQARGGTLYLRQVELLNVETQYKLLQLAKGRYLHNGPNLGVPIDIKLIVSSEVSLKDRVSAGQFRKDLYYALSAFRVEIPPLRCRREDIPGWFERILSDWSGKMARQVRLTQDAKEYLTQYDWPGNLDQMESLCQRLVLLSEKRTVDEAALRESLKDIDSERAPLEGRADRISPRAMELIELLNRHHGSREKAAEELGISKTTLWRRMKKYGITRDLTME